MNVIEINDLSKCYNSTILAIDKVSFNVEKGDFFGFIGPNGAGKSTTIRTLLGLISKTSGSAKIFGCDVSLNSKDLLKDIGYLPSEVSIYPGMKVKDALRFYLNLHGITDMTNTLELASRLNLNLDMKVDELSLGNKKKVGIVIALQHNPSLLILDEPTSGLDPLMQRVFFEILQERNKQGVTIMLSSHVLNEISKYCNKAAIISKGKIIISDKVSNLSHTLTKYIEIESSSILELESLPGIKNLSYQHNTYKFYYDGDINLLISLLSINKISDIRIFEPPLEDIFMHYYEMEN